MSNLQCPHCGKWSADCEALPGEQQEWRPVKCYKCRELFAIKWQVEHYAKKLSDLPDYLRRSREFMKEMEEASAN
jgi:phage FluMu protein Com